MYRTILAVVAVTALTSTVCTQTASAATSSRSTHRQAVSAFLSGDKAKAEQYVASLPAKEQAAAVKAMTDEVATELSTIKLDTTAIDTVVRQVTTARVSRCGRGQAEGYKSKLGVEFHLEITVETCGDGHGSVNRVNVVSSDVWTNIPGVSTHHRNNGTRILNYNRSGRGVARWTIGVTVWGKGFTRSVCPQLQVGGWRPPLLIGRVMVEQKWNDKCTLF